MLYVDARNREKYQTAGLDGWISAVQSGFMLVHWTLRAGIASR
jgi:hypothetical protein